MKEEVLDQVVAQSLPAPPQSESEPEQANGDIAVITETLVSAEIAEPAETIEAAEVSVTKTPKSTRSNRASRSTKGTPTAVAPEIKEAETAPAPAPAPAPIPADLRSEFRSLKRHRWATDRFEHLVEWRMVMRHG